MSQKTDRLVKGSTLLSRVDLLKLQDEGLIDGADFVAKQLGLIKTIIDDLPDINDGVPNSVETEQEPPYCPIEEVAPLFWYLARRKERKTEEPEKVVTEIKEWSDRPKKIPQHRPLPSTKKLLTELLSLLLYPRSCHKTDIPQVIKALSRLEHLPRLPRQMRMDGQQPLLIIDDRSRHLTPYWKDQHQVSALLVQQAYPNLQFAVWVDGEKTPRLITPEGLVDWKPPSEFDVLLLSDLGALQTHGYHERNCLRLGRELQHLNCQLFSIIPCPITWVLPSLSRLFHCLSHDTSSSEVDNEKVERLLTALSPCIRIEPALMRDMRLKMAKLGEDWQLSPAVEAWCWQSSALQESHSVAASWNADERKSYLRSFEVLSDEEKTTVLGVIRDWRADPELSEDVWYEEILSLDSATEKLPAIVDNVKQAKSKLRFLVQQLSLNQFEMSESLKAYYRRMESRLPETRITELSDFQRLLPYIHPKNHIPSVGEPKEVVLFQRRNTLRLWPLGIIEPYTSDKHPPYGYSPIVVLKTIFGSVQFTTRPGVLEHLSLETNSSVVIDGYESLIVDSGFEILELDTMKTPHSSTLGRDHHGLFADTKIGSQALRLRYIEPNHPKSEAFWLSDETFFLSLFDEVLGIDRSPKYPKNSVRLVTTSQISANEVSNAIRRIGVIIPGWVIHIAPAGKPPDRGPIGRGQEKFEYNLQINEEALVRVASELNWIQFLSEREPGVKLYLQSQQNYVNQHDFSKSSLIEKTSWLDFSNGVQNPSNLEDGELSERFELLEQCQEAFHKYPNFIDMPLAIRKMIAGLPNAEGSEYNAWYWFGNMKSNGRFHSLIIKNNQHISQALGEIPFVGLVNYEHVKRFFQSFQNAFDDEYDGKGLGVSCASRLLAMKRPDYFVPISAANKDGLIDLFDTSQSQLGSKPVAITYWDNIIALILFSKWWNQPEENIEDKTEQTIWRFRAALLDVICYEANNA